MTVTSASESGSTVSFHRSLRLFTRPAFVARPPATATTSSRNLRPLIQLSGSLNAILSVNALSPSCSAGTSSNDAVSGGGPSSGPRTAVVMLTDNGRPSAVQIAPASPQARFSGCKSETNTTPFDAGTTVISHRSSRPSTRRTPVTEPLITPTLGASIATASLNAIRSVNALSPSCPPGWSSKLAVSAVISSSSCGSACAAWPCVAVAPSTL